MVKFRSVGTSVFLFATLFFSSYLQSQQSSTTTLSATPTTVNSGQAVNINATVVGATDSIPIPSGSVTFLDGSTSLGTVSLSALAVARPTAYSFAQVFGPFRLAFDPVWADFNGDGKPDLLMNSLGSLVQVYLNNGDGSFTQVAAQSCDAGFISAIDFNGDGKMDILSVYTSGTAYTVEVCYGNGDGTFQSAVVAPGITVSTVGFNPTVLAVALLLEQDYRTSSSLA